MNKLIMMSGLPASGKSTLAKSLAKDIYPNAIRVNKDLLREMLHFGEYSWKNEKEVTACEEYIVREYLAYGNDVIVDDTNLTDYHEDKWAAVAANFKSTFIKNKLNTSWQECVMRDMERQTRGERFVGEYVIKNMAMSLGQVDGQYIICDLDGTLCNIDDRKHFVSGTGDKSWEKFFANIPGDKVRENIAEAVRDYHDKGYRVVYLSGRPEDYKDQTIEWLQRHGLNFNFSLIMRKKGDKRPDTQVKFEMLNKYFPDRNQIHGVIDDRPCVVRMWQEQLGFIRVWDVGDGIDF